MFNAGGGSCVTLKEAIALLGEALGQPLETDYQPPERGDVPDTLAANERIVSELGWAPAVGLAEGLARQVAWTREEDA